MSAVNSIIWKRLQEAGVVPHANSNISEFIEERELPLLKAEIAEKLRELMKVMLIDTENDPNSIDTPNRVAKMYVDEVFRGRYHAPPKVTDFKIEDAKKSSEPFLLGPITLRSACSHHLVPIIGEVWVSIITGPNVVGISKFSRIVEWVAARPQIQEEMTKQILEEVLERCQPEGVAVFVKAKHMCMTWRGVRDDQVYMQSQQYYGAFESNHRLRREFLSLIAASNK